MMRGEQHTEQILALGRSLGLGVFRRLLTLVALILFALVIARAQTVVNAVTDAASFAPRVAPGALATIFGSNLANSTQQAAGVPLPRTMAGATVYVNESPVPLLLSARLRSIFKCRAICRPGRPTCTLRALAAKAGSSSSRL
jgi:hypothetical protein